MTADVDDTKDWLTNGRRKTGRGILLRPCCDEDSGKEDPDVLERRYFLFWADDR